MTLPNADDPRRTTDHSPNAGDQRDEVTADFPVASDSECTATYGPEQKERFVEGLPERLKGPATAIPGYQIEGVLGRGGMGVVYKARHLRLKRAVALKMILSGSHAGEGERQRFRSEAEAVARLQHPNIVQVYEVGEHEGVPYAALEFIEGGTFALRLKRSPVSPREAAEMIATVAGAMHLAHSRNIVHRDLKPANILLDANGSPKVTDFGVARQLDSDHGQTQTGMVVGTPSYMAPEQAAGETKQVGPAADVYALGAILYECLLGRPPFQGATVVATLQMVRTQEPVAPRSVRSKVPADLETICLKCLRKEPEKRYASADALANDLRRWLQGEPIRARPVPLWERVLLWARRRPALAALVVLVHVFLAVLLGLGVWSYSEINRALANANAAKLKSQQMSAGLALDRGLQLCQEGKVSEGMLWMAESLAFNPEQDRGFADVVRLNLAAWRRPLSVQRMLIEHERAVSCVAYSPDGKTIATAAGGTVSLRDASTSQTVGQPLVHPGPVLSIGFSRDGRRLATGTYDKSVRIWDVATSKLIGQPIPQSDMVNSVAFSQDGRWLLATTGFRDHPVASWARIWEVATGKPVSPPLSHPATIRGGVFILDRRLAITGGYDGLIRFWDCSTWALSGEPIKVPAEVMTLAPSRDGLFLAVGCNSGEAFVYDVSSRRLMSSPMRHAAPVNAICFHPDDGLVATACADSMARLWDWLPGQQVGPPLVHQNYVEALDFSPDGRRLITGAADKFARIWELPLQARKGTPLTQSDPTLMLSNLDPSLVSARPRTRITGDRGRPIPHWVSEYLCASFSPDGRYVVTGSIDNSARVWEVATGRLIGQPLGHDNWVRTVAFSPDNQHVLTGSHDMTARLWDIHTGEALGLPLRHAGGIVSVAISPDGTKALTGGGDKAARLWHLQSGAAIGLPMLHGAEVLSVSFSNNGAFALTAGGSEVRLWDSATALPIGPPARHDGSVTSVRFADDDRSFLTLSDDGTARRWPMPQPVAGDPDLVKSWVQTITGQEKDAGKSVSVFGAVAWRERRARVMESALATDLDAAKDAILAWHDGAAGANEVSGIGEPAYWHLDRLIAASAKDWSLHARRAGVLHRQGHDAEALKELDQARALGGLNAVRDWCGQRAANLERLHQHQAALWFRTWIAAVAPNQAEAHDDLGHCKARLGRFAEASEHFARAAALAPDRIDFQRDLAMARLALGDRAGYRTACARMIELALATEDRDAAQMTALTCVLDANTVPKWDAVIRLASRAAEGYDGDYRIHVAALFRAGRFDEALQRPWSKDTRYAHIVWEWFFQGMLRYQAGRQDEARSILDQKFKMIDYMDQDMLRDPSSKIWSDWIYHVQCHVLRSEAEAMLGATRLSAPPSAN